MTKERTLDAIGAFTAIPNWHYDYMPLLTDAEWKILTFITRKTLGFTEHGTDKRKVEDRISYSQFIEATGYNRTKLHSALQALRAYGFVETPEGDVPRRLGVLYRLQLDKAYIKQDAIDAAVEARKAKHTSSAQNAAKARIARSQNSLQPKTKQPRKNTPIALSDDDIISLATETNNPNISLCTETNNSLYAETNISLYTETHKRNKENKDAAPPQAAAASDGTKETKDQSTPQNSAGVRADALTPRLPATPQQPLSVIRSRAKVQRTQQPVVAHPCVKAMQEWPSGDLDIFIQAFVQCDMAIPEHICNTEGWDIADVARALVVAGRLTQQQANAALACIPPKLPPVTATQEEIQAASQWIEATTPAQRSTQLTHTSDADLTWWEYRVPDEITPAAALLAAREMVAATLPF